MTQTIRFPATIALLASFLFVEAVTAVGASAMDTIAFVPPNDPTGAVTSTDSNDAYLLGRGVVFEMVGNQFVEGVGIYHDLTDVELSYELAETLVVSGNVTAGQTVLASGSQTVTTNGLEWIDFSFDGLSLVNGRSYHIEFTHSANGNQNFFYDNQNVPFTEGNFASLDGTQFGNTQNFSMPAVRVIIPEPSTLVFAALGMFVIGCRPRKLG